MSLSVSCRMGCISGGRRGNREGACCFLTSSVCSSVISHLQGREKHFSCCTAPSPVLCSFYTANALSSLLGCIQPQSSLASTFPFRSRFSLVCRRNCPFPGAVQSQAHRSYCTSQKFFWKEIQPFASIIPLLQAADDLTF